MNVQSLAFLAFLIVTVCVCRLLPKERILVLLAASLVFYLWGGAPSALWGCGLLAVSSFVSYLAANTLRKHRRKSVLLAVVCYHIAVLGIFKYTGFFTGGAVRMPFVPLGISFFTFQQIWYLREVYAGTFSQVPTPAEYLTYSFFFPTVSSGPILKPGNFFPQLRETSPLPQDTAAGLYAIGLGLAKKVLLADNLGVLVNNGWGSLSELTALTAWCVILGYTLQLYFDFSGYCDLTAGCARLLGLRLPIQLRLSLPESIRYGVLEAVAHDPDGLPPGERLLSPGRQPKGPGAYIPEHSGGVPRQRHLARRGVDLHPLGPASRAGAGSGTPVGKTAGRSAPLGPVGHDLPLYQPCVGLFPGTGCVLCPAFAENRRYRRDGRDPPVAGERLVPPGRSARWSCCSRSSAPIQPTCGWR